jgi:hypothetical protein
MFAALRTVVPYAAHDEHDDQARRRCMLQRHEMHETNHRNHNTEYVNSFTESKI